MAKNKAARKKPKAKGPPQVTLGGEVGQQIWRQHVLPLIKKDDLSTWAIADMLGVSAMTVSRWRRAYL